MIGHEDNRKRIVPLMVRWKKGENIISAKEQAELILQNFEAEINKGKNVAITYSANNEQAKAIYDGYTSGSYSISGSNQAEVIKLVIKGIHKRKWENRAHILPVATCMKSGGKGEVSQDIVMRDLKNIAQHVGAGWTVFGYQNQDHENTTTLAIAGKGAISEAVWDNAANGNKPLFDSKVTEMIGGRFEGELERAFKQGQNFGAPLMATKRAAVFKQAPLGEVALRQGKFFGDDLSAITLEELTQRYKTKVESGGAKSKIDVKPLLTQMVHGFYAIVERTRDNEDRAFNAFAMVHALKSEYPKQDNNMPTPAFIKLCNDYIDKLAVMIPPERLQNFKNNKEELIGIGKNILEGTTAKEKKRKPL